MATMDIVYTVLAVTLICQLSHAAPVSPTKHAQHSHFHCSPCAPGYGVTDPCSQSEDTVCEACRPAFHSKLWSSTEPCHTCSRCGAGLYELHVCNATNDVFCELCAYSNDKDNPDFQLKCDVIGENGISTGNSKSKLWARFKKNSFGVHKKALRLSNDEVVGSVVEDMESSEKKVADENKVVEESEVGGDSQVVDGSQVNGENKAPGKSGVPDGSDVAAEKEKTQEDTSKTDPSIETPATNENLKEASIKPEKNMDDHDSKTMSAGSNEDSDDLDIIKGAEAITPDVLNADDSALEEETVEVKPLEDGSGVVEFTVRVEPPTDPPQLEPKEAEEMVEEEEVNEVEIGIAAVDTRELEETEEDPEVDAFAGSSYAAGNQDQPGVGASQDGGVGTFPILMAVVTAGLIFFVLGFLLNRYRSSSGSKHDGSTPETVSMKPVYAATPTQPPDEDKDEKSAPTKSTTPEIIYTNHDEPDVQGAPPDVILQPPPSANKRQQQVKKPMPPIGKYQSPINIDPDDAELSDDLENSHLVFKYVPENTKSLTNLGSTVKVMVDCRGSDLHGGPLGDDRRYCLDHFRFRWGADDTRGSEHSVAGKRYAGEIQLVHWNKEDFRTYSEASRYESGLAIISVFMNVSEEQHTSLQTLLDVFKSIKYKGDSVEVPHHYFDPASLLPGNTMDYWTYSGSLTESPYPETVTWLVMKEPISVSSSQMVQLRGLMRCERDEAHGMPGEEQLVDNFRKQSALGDRRLRASFH